MRDGGVPDWYYQGLGLTSALRASSRNLKFNYQIVLAALRAAWGPGRRRVYLIEKPGHIFGNATARLLFGHVQKLVHYAVFRVLGVRTSTFGVSIGPLSSNLQRVEALRARLCYYYSVRDSLSVAYANDIGIRRVAYFVGPAIRLQPA